MNETKLEQFKVRFNNYKEYQDVVKEVFGDDEYNFLCSKNSPFIIDCGSHIGLSVLYFKIKHPQSKIIAFEPNPENFTLLSENIKANNLQDVELINGAVSDSQGDAFLFGEFGQANPRSCGNSLISIWANSQINKIKIKTLLLSSFINQEVDFLKLDIEGSELKVLLEIQDKLSLVSELCIEYHGFNNPSINDLDKILNLLDRCSFNIEIKYKNLRDYFPPELVDWAIDSKFSLATIRAKKKLF